MPSKCIFNLQYFLFPHCLELVPVFCCTKNIKAFRRGFYGSSIASICTISSVFLLFCLKRVLMSPLFYIPTPVMWLQPLFQSSQWYQSCTFLDPSYEHTTTLCSANREVSLHQPDPLFLFAGCNRNPGNQYLCSLPPMHAFLIIITPASSVPFANPSLKIPPISITCDIHTVLAHGYSLLFNMNG